MSTSAPKNYIEPVSALRRRRYRFRSLRQWFHKSRRSLALPLAAHLGLCLPITMVRRRRRGGSFRSCSDHTRSHGVGLGDARGELLPRVRRKLRNLPSDGGVKSVLGSIVGSAVEQLGDLAPAVAEARMGVHDDAVLLRGPRALCEMRGELVEPALPCLLAGAARDVRGNDGPAPRAEFGNEVGENCVLFRAPRTLDFVDRVRRNWGHWGRGER